MTALTGPPSVEEVRGELMALAAQRELVALRLPAHRRPGLLGGLRARLPERVRIISVRPITFAEWAELDAILPEDGVLRKWEWRRVRAWLALRDVYACSYEDFARLFPDVESLLRLQPLTDAWDRVNRCFRAHVEGRLAGGPDPPEPHARGHPALGSRPLDPGATGRARLGAGAGAGHHVPGVA